MLSMDGYDGMCYSHRLMKDRLCTLSFLRIERTHVLGIEVEGIMDGSMYVEVPPGSQRKKQRKTTRSTETSTLLCTRAVPFDAQNTISLAASYDYRFRPSYTPGRMEIRIARDVPRRIGHVSGS